MSLPPSPLYDTVAAPTSFPSLLVRSMSWHIRFNDDRFRTGGLLPVISGCRKVFQNATLTLWRAPRVGRRFPGNSSSLREWLILFLLKSWQCWPVKINAGELRRIYPPIPTCGLEKFVILPVNSALGHAKRVSQSPNIQSLSIILQYNYLCWGSSWSPMSTLWSQAKARNPKGRNLSLETPRCVEIQVADAVLCAQKLPELRTDLIATLPHLMTQGWERWLKIVNVIMKEMLKIIIVLYKYINILLITN